MTVERNGAAQHGSDCRCTRCAGFEPGHELSLSHGAYSKLKLTKRAGELVDELRDLVTRYRPSDEPLVRLLAMTWARLEAAMDALEGADDPGKLQRLEHDLRLWVNTARRLLADLGMSPTARARMGLDVAQTARALNITDLAAAALELDERDEASS